MTSRLPKTTKRTAWIAFSLLALAVLLAVPLSDEFTRASLFGSKGYKETGSKFGIAVGMGRDEATRVLLNHGFVLIEDSLDPNPAPRSCEGSQQSVDQQVEYWSYDEGWRSTAIICLESRNSSLRGFSWNFVSWEL